METKEPIKNEETKAEAVTKKPSLLPKIFTLSPFVALVSAIFIYFASTILAVSAITVIGKLQGKDSAGITANLNSSLVTQTILYFSIAVIATLLVSVLLQITGSSFRSIGFTKPKLKHVKEAFLGFGWYFLLQLAATLFVGLFVSRVDLDQAQALIFDKNTVGISLAFIAFSLVVVPAFYEELLMRGVLFTGLRSRLSFWYTLVIISSLFGAAHLEWLGDGPLNYAAAIDTFVFSAVLVYLRENSKSIWPAILLHGIKNSIAFLILFVFKRGGI